jgi:hypothetical protein
MQKTARSTTALAVASLLTMVASAHAAVLCAKKSGAVLVRATKCNKKETAVDPTALGLIGPKGEKGDKGDQGEPGPLVVAENWHEVGAPGEPAFESGAANARPNWICSSPDPQPAGCPTYETAGFYKDPFGVVHLKGSLKLGGSTIAFTLPPGYRPARARAFKLTVEPETTNATLVIYDENVQIIQDAGYSGNEIYSLDSVSFLAAQ